MAYLSMSHIFYEMGRYKFAASYGEEAITANPYYPSGYIRSGWAYYRLGNYPKAVTYLNKALSLNLNDEDKFSVYHALGSCAYAEEDYDDGIENFKKAENLDPENKHVCHDGLGWGYLAKGMFGDAREQFEKAIELSSKFANAYHGLGTTYLWDGNYKEAIEYLEKALEINPDQPLVKKRLKEAKLRLKEVQGIISSQTSSINEKLKNGEILLSVENDI
jgi:tetratricopeptide (TPR) repeat protein